MSTLREEEEADQFYLAREHVIRQAELVNYLLRRCHPVLAHRAIQATLSFFSQWEDKPWQQMDLMNAYQYARAGIQ